MSTVARLWLLSTLTVIRHLRSNLMRTMASLSAMAVAVASVIVMVGIGEGAQQNVRDLVAKEGVNVIYVLSALRNVKGVLVAQGTKTSLTLEDAVNLKMAIPELQEICWWRQDPSRVIYRNENQMARVLSISPGCQSIKGWMPESGIGISQAHFAIAEQVALVGHTVVRHLFHDSDPVGATVRIRNIPFKIIGVLEEKGTAPGGYDQDDIVLVPYSTSKRKMLNHTESYIETIAAATYDREELPKAAESIRDLLRNRHQIAWEHPDDFTVRTQLEIEKFYEETSETLTWFLSVIASISLIVGGIGIMNILLVSVTERTREIGVRMAVGAKRRHILMQFLIEAMTLSLVGGALGIVLGVAGAKLTTLIAGWPTVISGNVIVTAFVFSLAVGLFFGLYPANKAARLNPIEALRYE